MYRNIVCGLFLFSACGTTDEHQIDAATSSVVAPVTHSKGLWLYSPDSLIGDRTQVNALISLMLEQGMNELYLSTNFALLDDAALPGFILRMSNNGFAVEALIGKTEWGTQSGRADMLSQISRLLAYNATQTYSQRFKNLHLDIEPWVGSGSNTSWVTPLLQSFAAATKALLGTSLQLTIDLAGSKVANLPLAERQSFFSAANKVVLMEYEASLADATSRAERFVNGLGGGGAMVVAVRAEDFSEPYQTAASFDGCFAGDERYAGWAIYDYGEL